MKKYLFAIFWISTILFAELHTFFARKTGQDNWIIARYHPMTLQWNIWFVVQELNYFLMVAGVWFWQRNRVNSTTLRVFTYFAAVDILLYFYNFKTYEYGKVYIWMAAAWLLIYFKKQITGFLWRTLNQWK